MYGDVLLIKIKCRHKSAYWQSGKIHYKKILPKVAQGTKTLYNLLTEGNKKLNAADLTRSGGV